MLDSRSVAKWRQKSERRVSCVCEAKKTNEQKETWTFHISKTLGWRKSLLLPTFFYKEKEQANQKEAIYKHSTFHMLSQNKSLCNQDPNCFLFYFASKKRLQNPLVGENATLQSCSQTLKCTLESLFLVLCIHTLSLSLATTPSHASLLSKSIQV